MGPSPWASSQPAGTGTTAGGGGGGAGTGRATVNSPGTGSGSAGNGGEAEGGTVTILLLYANRADPPEAVPEAARPVPRTGSGMVGRLNAPVSLYVYTLLHPLRHDRAGAVYPPTISPPMKNTLRLIAAAAVLAIATPAFAQGGGGGGGRGMQMTPEQFVARQKELLFKDITLAPAVAAKADTIIMNARAKQMEAMQAARAGGGDMAAMQEANQKLTKERNDALKALLSDADKAKFDANVAAMPQGRGRGGF